MKIDGTPENDNLTGTAGNDTIVGLDGNDILNGGRGDDVIVFGAGQKNVNGGAGNDSLDLNFADQTEDLVLTYNVFEEPSPTTEGILEGTTIQNIEKVDLVSGSGNDLIDIAATSVGSEIAGGAGEDTLIGGLGNDSLDGGAGDNTFFGGDGDDVITGGADNDAAVFLGLASNYEVVLGETFVTVTGAALETLPEDTDEEATPTTTPESFTDTLSGVEIILFENAEIIVETGEFKLLPAFEPDSPEDEEPPTVRQGNDEDLAPEENPGETPEIGGDGIPVYEFFRTDTQTQYYTTEEAEKNTTLDLPEYESEGISFIGAAPPAGEEVTGISPVYRFLNNDTGAHLYTVDENERDFVEENLDNYTLNGTPYYSYDTQIEGTVPLYRFLNPDLNAHFYTSSIEEKDAFVESPDYQLEGENGIAFYVEPAPNL